VAPLAAKLCGSEGAYRGPSGPSYVYITFRDIKISKQPATPQIKASFRTKPLAVPC
jgi:hypothetical protein